MNELLFAQLAAMVVNTSFRAPKEHVSIEAFMPSQWAKQKVRKPRKRSRRAVQKDIVSFWRAIATTAKVTNADNQS